jgi:hypothetical protein
MRDLRNHTPYRLQPKCSKCKLPRPMPHRGHVCKCCMRQQYEQSEQRKHDMNAARILAMWQPNVNFAMQSVLYI